jgi:3',5'-cyclic AMP phosphodiesterase CpdA
MDMWRFVHLTDPHLGSIVDGEWNNRFLCTMMPGVMACLRRDLAHIKPDFVLVTGDIASQQTRDAVFAARDFLDALHIRYYPAGGNHDSLCAASREWFIEAFQPHLPGGDTVYAFTHKHLHFCVLDPWWLWTDGTLSPVNEPSAADSPMALGKWALPPQQLKWLEHDLRRHRNMHTIVAVHVPAIPLPGRLQRPDLKYAGHLENGAALLEILQRHSQVKAMLTGHLHMHCIERVNGLAHVVTGALPEYPVEYRDIQVYPDRIEIHTCALTDTAFASRSLIENRKWTGGQTVDRHHVIPL